MHKTNPMMKKTISLLSAILLALSVQAARVDTVMVKSPSMNKDVRVLYILPDKVFYGDRCPVIYLLHGYSDNATTWSSRKPELAQIADSKGIIFVCPDGNNSWYWDSPVDPSFRYETFVSSELVDYTDSHYATFPQREARAITGNSMGGHGAMWLAIRHQDVFGAAGCMSGGVDIRPFPDNWEMKKRIGEKNQNPEVWEAHTVMNQLDKLENGKLALIMDCGLNDFFFGVNEALHNELVKRKIDHDYIARPGGHSWPYWRNAVEFQILFFERYFAQHASKRPATKDLKIVFIGNSITQGALLKDAATEAPPAQACRYIGQSRGAKVAFRNCGVSGMTTVDFLPVVNGCFSRVRNAVAELAKENGQLVFSISLGTNDSSNTRTTGAPVLPSVYYTNMKAIIDELLLMHPSAKVVIQCPIWYSPNTYNGAMYLKSGLERLQSYVPMIEKLVAHYGSTRPGQVFVGDRQAFNFFKENHQTHFTPENGNAGTFYLHPNKEGAAALGKYWAEAILSVIP